MNLPNTSEFISNKRQFILYCMAALFLALPLLTLIASYTIIALTQNTLSIWSLPVHEDGIRTFSGTVFYFEHAARELPLDIILGCAIGYAAAFGFGHHSQIRPRNWWLGAASIYAVILIGTFAECGTQSLYLNIFQFHTRPNADLIWGAHWYYHFFSRLSLILLSFGLGFLAKALTGAQSAYRDQRSMLVILAVFAALSLFFLGSWKLPVLAVSDPVYLGHQAREIFTHGLVTVPLAFSLCLLLNSPKSLHQDRNKSESRYWIIGVAISTIAFLIVLYVGLNAFLGDAVNLGQSSDFKTLLFPHFFEHSFTYLATPLTALSVHSTLQSEQNSL